MILSLGSHWAALLGERARSEVWGADPHAAVCTNPNPTATIRIVDDGVVVSGQRQPMSGCHHAG